MCGFFLTPDVRGSGLLVTSRESSQYHQHANPSLLLAKQKASKVAFSKSLLSESEDLDLVKRSPRKIGRVGRALKVTLRTSRCVIQGAVQV